MSLVADRSQALTGAHGAVIELAEGDAMVYRASSGIAAPQLGLRLQRQSSLSGLCVEQGQALRCDDSESDPRVDREACRRVGLRSMIVAPLKHQDTVVGALKVVSRDARAFTDVDQRILGLMCDLVAASMFHAARYETSELYHRATHDPLTGLANRALFFDRLRSQLELAQRNASPLAILNVDMDGLKPINDRFGHRAGDAAIKELASRIKDTFRESDTVARVGGDEFAVILPQRDRDGAEQHTQRLAQNIETPFRFGEQPLALGASIGAAAFPDDGTEPDVLLEHADHAMYAAKRQRKGGAPPR